MVEKKFCDFCGEEIEDKDEVLENTIYIRLGREDGKFNIQDICEDCKIEFRQKFSKYIKEKKEKRNEG